MYIDEIRKNNKDVTPDAVIKIQNISNFIFQYPAQEINPEDVFSYKAPFPKMWLEFKFPEYINVDGKPEKMSRLISNREMGVYVITDTCDEDGIPFGDFFKVSFIFYSEFQGKNINFMEGSVFPFNSGKIEKDTDLLLLPSKEFIKMLEKLKQDDADEVMKILKAFCFAPIPSFFNFYHCKNVKLEKTEFSKKLIKSRQKKGHKDYFEAFYTVSIEPMKKVLKESFHCDKIGVNKALQAFHIVPGHYKEYIKDENGNGGLFGKLEGVWWWDNFVKGSKNAGVIHKDYDVDLKNITNKTKLISRI